VRCNFLSAPMHGIEFLEHLKGSIQELSKILIMASPSRIRSAPFTEAEDTYIIQSRRDHPDATWAAVAALLPPRNARQCRERYLNYLAPSLRKAPWTPPEDLQLWDLVRRFGMKWAMIGRQLGGRSATDVKNR
jgi:hypothetical protein